MEYATREQAQQAVNTLSNQNLMGRLVYVREVRIRGCTVCVRVIRLLKPRIGRRNRGSSVVVVAVADSMAAWAAAAGSAAVVLGPEAMAAAVGAARSS